jgi:Ca-activated chloride channel family protein
MFTFGIGRSVNRHLIEGMAHAGMGESFVALDKHDAIRKAVKFREYISSPVMQGIKVDFDGFKAYDVEPPAVPDLFARRPVILFGKYRGSPKGTISISGRVPGEKLRGRMQAKYGDLSADNAALRYLWARHRVRRLSDLNVFGRDEEPVKEITRLGLNYNIMTAYTSFVAVDSRPRAKGQKAVKVKQPLPLPEGVSNKAIGNTGMLGVLGTTGKGGGNIGYGGGFGGLSLRGSGAGGGGRGKAAYSMRRSSPVNIRSGQVKVMGSLSSSQIRRFIRKYKHQMKLCYTKALKKNPGLAGKVVVKIHIDKNGKVKKVEIVSSTIKCREMEKCMLKAIKKWQFPAPHGGGEVVINYPFIFTSTP